MPWRVELLLLSIVDEGVAGSCGTPLLDPGEGCGRGAAPDVLLLSAAVWKPQGRGAAVWNPQGLGAAGRCWRRG